MRSLLSRAPAEEPDAPPDTRPEPTAPAAAQPEQPQPGLDQPLQAQLYSATERLALALINRAEQELLTPPKEGGSPASVKELQAAVEFAMNLLVKLPKLKPEDADKEDAGVDMLRQALAEPAAVVERLIGNAKFTQALKAKGWLPPPARPAHRPTREQQAERVEYEARAREQEMPEDDDSELKRMLSKGAAA